MEWVAQLSHLNYMDYVHIWFDIELYFIQLLSFVHYVQMITLWILLLIAFQLSVINFKVNSAAAKLAIFHIRITIKEYHASMSFELLSNLWYRTPTKKTKHTYKKRFILANETRRIHTICMSCTDTAVQEEATILQNAVVLYPHLLVFVHFMKQSETLWVFHSQWGQVRVVSSDIHPHVVLKHES